MKDVLKESINKRNDLKRKKYSNLHCLNSYSNYSNYLVQARDCPASTYEKTFENLNLKDNIYCKNSLGETFPIKIDLDQNIVLPEFED